MIKTPSFWPAVFYTVALAVASAVSGPDGAQFAALVFILAKMDTGNA